MECWVNLNSITPALQYSNSLFTTGVRPCSSRAGSKTELGLLFAPR
jgi:hypothetical protein